MLFSTKTTLKLFGGVHLLDNTVRDYTIQKVNMVIGIKPFR